LAALASGSSELNSHNTFENIHSTDGTMTGNNITDSSDSTSTSLNTFAVTVHSHNHNITKIEQNADQNHFPTHELSNANDDNKQSRPIENFKRKRGRPRKYLSSQETMNSSLPPSQTTASKHNLKQYTAREGKKEQFYWNYVYV
jgi:hypothetical protein